MIKKNIFPIVIALVILILSITDSGNFNKIRISHFRNADKIAHLLMYSALTFSLVLANRNRLSKPLNYIVLALVPLFYGFLIEMAQKFFTTSRSGDFLDLCFNIIGITLAVITWLIIKKIYFTHLK